MTHGTIKTILLSGPPGCGKTTVIRRLVEQLGDLRLAGFYTQEIRERGQRVGFEAIGLSGQRAVVAHVRSHSQHQVGRYGVKPDQLQPLVQQELDDASDVDVVLIDEVGKMELFCPAFVDAVPRLLDEAVPVLLTVAQKGRGLIAQVKARADVCLVLVNAPRRFNPTGTAWLAVLHAQRASRHYTAPFSNTARAHELGMTHDWMVVYRDDPDGHGQWTVITSQFGPLRGRRIIRGREGECAACYAQQPKEPVPPSLPADHQPPEAQAGDG